MSDYWDSYWMQQYDDDSLPDEYWDDDDDYDEDEDQLEYADNEQEDFWDEF